MRIYLPAIRLGEKEAHAHGRLNAHRQENTIKLVFPSKA